MLHDAKNLINFKKNPLKKIELLRSEGSNLPIKDNIVDVILCLETLEHVFNINKVINEIYRILKKDGIFIFSVPIEIGFSLLIRQLIVKLIRFQDDHNYSIKELFQIGILKKVTSDRQHLYNNKSHQFTHKNYDFRNMHQIINKKFKTIKVTFKSDSYL